MESTQQNKKHIKCKLELAKECLEKEVVLCSWVRGCSMFPFINYSDKVLIRRILPNEVKIGDIILIHTPIEENLFIAHRVIRISKGIKGKEFFTKGDFVLSFDELGKQIEVIGRIVRIIKKGKIKINLENKKTETLSYLIAKYSCLVSIFYGFFKKRMCLPEVIVKICEIISIIPIVITFAFYMVYKKLKLGCERFILCYFQIKRSLWNAKSSQLE